MHLLVTAPGEISDGTEAVDLDQAPGDIVVLSAAASDLSILSAARARMDVVAFAFIGIVTGILGTLVGILVVISMLANM